MNKKLARQIFYFFIVGNIFTIWYFSYTNNSSFNIDTIKAFLEGQNLFIALFIYTLILTIRGLTLIPGTPLLVLGAILFPMFWALLAVQVAVQSYIFIIHKYSKLLDFKIPQKILDYEKKIEKHGVPFIIILCVIPWMSMNVMAYFLSSLKVPLSKQMIWIWIGSTVNLFLYLNVFKILFNSTT